MIYSVSSISNRDVQLLYHYRMLKQPAGNLQAVFRQLEPVSVTFPSIGTSTGSVTENLEPLYSFTTSIEIPENKIPLLEFSGDENDWAKIEYLTTLDVSSNQITLYSTSPELGDTTQVSLFWCSSVQAVSDLLSKYAEEIAALWQEVESLRKTISGLDLGEGLIKDLHGIENNLVKFGFDADLDRVFLTDSEHQIVGATESQTLMNPSQEELSRLVKDLGGPIKIAITDSGKRILEGFRGYSLTVTGKGTWFLTNVKSTVIFSDFSGSVYANHCSHIRTYGNYNRIKDLQLAQSFLTHRQGIIESLKIAQRSAVKHMGKAQIKVLEQVGIACEYYSQVEDPKYEPKFEWDTVQGTLNLSDGFILHNGFEVSFQTGHHDDPLPGTITVTGGTYVPGTPSNPIDGDSIAAQCWNWFIQAGIPGVSDKPEVVAGIIGNMMQETGGGTYDLMILGCGNGYYGPWCESNSGFRSAVEAAGYSWYSYYGGTRSANETDAIPTVFQWLTQDSSSYVDWFATVLSSPTNQSGTAGARSYAELFCVCIERCVGGEGSIEDPGVYKAMTDYYGGTVYTYQDLETRRSNAERVYNEFYVGNI